MNNKVLITGGSGFLGFHLTRFLKSSGFNIKILDLVLPNKEEYPDVEFITGDVRNLDLVKKAAEGVVAIVHAAAALPLWSAKDILTVNIEGTRNILEASRLIKIPRTIFVSSTAVYGIPKKHPILEDDPLYGVGPYGESKIEAEKICLEMRKAGLCVPVVRPKTFIGPNRLGIFSLLYDWIYSGKKVPMIGDGHNRYQLLEVEDLCRAIFLTLTMPDDLVNDTFNVGAKEFKTVYEDLGCLCNYAKTGAKPIGTPAGIVKFFLALFEKIKISPLYKWVYATADKDSFVSIDKIEKKLGWAPRFSNCEALIRSYEWFLRNQKNFQGKDGITHTIPWKQGVIGLIKKFF